jgi:hypothetical protein
MSNESIEQVVQSILPLFKNQFVEQIAEKYQTLIEDFEFVGTTTNQKFGATGSLLITDVQIKANVANEIKDYKIRIAIKFTDDQRSATLEMKNSLLLENKFFSYPEFSTAKLLYGSTEEPITLVYEGLEGRNYDEIEGITDKSFYAGKLLAIIHGPELKQVDDALYQNLARMLAQHLEPTGKEVEISHGLKNAYEQISGMPSGCNPFSDFHQSNVMIQLSSDNSQIAKMYVIDPEFMQVGRFDRMEDTGTFFGSQFLSEFANTGSINQSIKDFVEFCKGYNSVIAPNNGATLNQIYPKGVPIQFTIALWTLLDTIDFVLNRTDDKSFNSPEVDIRIKFVLYILNSNELYEASKFKFNQNQ